MGLRDYKEFGEGSYYHIYNRGNGKNNIFLDKADFRFFIFKLRQNLFPELVTIKPERIRSNPLPKDSFTLINYCLMPNHFHLLLQQNSKIPTSKLMLKVCTSYSKYFNKKYQKVGHIFQDQFKQILIENNSYLIWLSAYIHQNPRVAGLVKNISDYEWSSYPDHIDSRKDDLCNKSVILDQFKNLREYKEFVESTYEIIKEKKDLEKLLLD